MRPLKTAAGHWSLTQSTCGPCSEEQSCECVRVWRERGKERCGEEGWSEWRGCAVWRREGCYRKKNGPSSWASLSNIPYSLHASRLASTYNGWVKEKVTFLEHTINHNPSCPWNWRVNGYKGKWRLLVCLELSLRIQWNLSIKDTLNKQHLYHEDTVCSPSHIDRAV